ncbi:MAG: GNAT family protein [Homoserinimonas sp.]
MGKRVEVSVKFLDELADDAIPEVLASLAFIEISPDQRDFSMPASAVLEKSRRDPSRRAFAIMIGSSDAAEVVGVGVLHPDGADRTVWPSGQPHVLLRGVSVDARHQGQGVGTAATGEAAALAQRAFPMSDAIVLTVHVDNVAGQRAYARVGFTYTGRTVSGRAGEEYVMSRPLNAVNLRPLP